jgi:predicted O-linked N-acetylglucosamine transferase (SPINDLY family)
VSVARRGALKSADELAQIGLRHHRAGDVAAAERSYRAALERSPSNVPGLTLLSTLLLEQREHEAALQLLDRAVQLVPELGLLHSNRGEALRRLGRSEEALVALERAVSVAPELSEAHYNLGLLLDQLGRLTEAVPAYENALELAPTARGLVTLLQALRDAGQSARGVRWYKRLASRVGESAELSSAFGGLLLDAFRIDEAVEHLQRACERDPTLAVAHAELAAALAERGELSAAISRLERAIEAEPANPRWLSHLVYLSAFSEEVSGRQLLEVARRFGREHAQELPLPASYQNSRDPERRLRVGYVSGDFRAHPIAQFLRPLFRAHDRSQVELYCYSTSRRTDAVTDELRSMVDAWRDLSALDDERAAAAVRADAIDVLVDLSQHSAGNRLLLFARKPAPVQLSWLGYPGPTGVPAIDYRITDPHLDPVEPGGLEDEALARLPETFWCYEPLSPHVEVSALPLSSNGYVTFGSLNSFKKVSAVTLDTWAQVLRSVPRSRLMLLAPEGQVRRRIAEVFSRVGVDPARLAFQSHVPPAEYLQLYQQIDIALDCITYGGGTTSLDAYWMGVPVVTLRGDAAVRRAGVSLASNLGLPQLIAKTSAGYVAIATRLARDQHELLTLRSSLRSRLQASPLMDAPRFAAALEDVFRRFWRHSVAGTLVESRNPV